ncbi:MAG: four helix bundle protein [Cyanobacteria bacterium J06633_8]
MIIGGYFLATSIIQNKSFNFALEIINLYSKLQQHKEYVISNQLLKSEVSEPMLKKPVEPKVKRLLSKNVYRPFRS